MGFLSDLKDNLRLGASEENACPRTAGWRQPQQKVSLKLVLLGILGLVIFLAANLFGRQGPQLPLDPETGVSETATKVNAPAPVEELTELQRFEQVLSTQLAQILSLVRGAGEVSVYVTLETGPEYDFAQDRSVETRTTEEQDTTGGQRVIQEVREDNQLVVVASAQGTTDEGLVRKELHPLVKGVLVVAAGAEDSRVKAELIRATKVLLGIGSHQVVVLPKER